LTQDTADIKPPWTPLKIIQWAVPYLQQKGISHPRLDVEILIAFALNIDRLKVYLQFDRPLDATELSRIRELLKRRSYNEPLQYIVGKREFFGFAFKVAPGVLIPRPETELLVEKVLEYMKGIPEDQRTILDLGTGSGCIAISIAQNIPCRVWATDISLQALEIAKENAQKLGVEGNIQWRMGSWFEALKRDDPSDFRLIVSNPPYIAIGEKGELAPEVRDFEPPEALFAGESGLIAYEQLAQNIGKRLSQKGVIFLELHAKRSDNIKQIFKKSLPEWRTTLFPDLQGLPRVLKLEN